MNPDWSTVSREQWAGTKEPMRNFTRNDRDPRPRFSYSSYTQNEPQSTMEKTGVEWKHSIPPSFSNVDADLGMKPDGQVELSERDQELSRKRKVLLEIEKQIILKKATLAFKNVTPFFNSNAMSQALTENEDLPQSIFDISLNNNNRPITLFTEHEKDSHWSPSHLVGKQFATHKASLKDRVNGILQLGLPSKANKSANSRGSSSFRKDGFEQQDHPLKLRVKALMKQRHKTSGKVPDVTPLTFNLDLPSAEERAKVAKGFQRFLSLLNKGVDVKLLTTIMKHNDQSILQSEELLLNQPPKLETKSNLHCQSNVQEPYRQIEEQCHSGTNSLDLSMEGHSHDDSHKEWSPLTNEKLNDLGSSPLASSSTSGYKPAIEQKRPKLEDQHEQLEMNIIKTLGLSFEEDDLTTHTTVGVLAPEGPKKRSEGMTRRMKRRKQKTREKIKRIKREKLEAFNQKMKQTISIQAQNSTYDLHSTSLRHHDPAVGMVVDMLDLVGPRS